MHPPILVALTADPLEPIEEDSMIIHKPFIITGDLMNFQGIIPG
jgi:hypothetical protein